MARKGKSQKLSRRGVQRLLSARNRGWILDPILSERDEWTECVRMKHQDADEELAKDTEPDESSDEFED